MDVNVEWETIVKKYQQRLQELNHVLIVMEAHVEALQTKLAEYEAKEPGPGSEKSVDLDLPSTI